MNRLIRPALAGFLLLAGVLQAQTIADRSIHYRPGDWISYPVTRFVTSIALGHEQVFFGTTEGIARYDFYRQQWLPPYTISDGLENDRIRIVTYDFNAGVLWCATDKGLSFRIPSSGEWRNLSTQELGISSVQAMGSGENDFWIRGSGQSLRGDRFGSYFQPAPPEAAEEDKVIWAEAGSKSVLSETEFYFMDSGYTYFPEGYIQDSQLRQFDITESMADNFFQIWTGTWGRGGGVIDTRSSSFTLLPSGPYSAGIEAMAWDDRGMWMGGNASRRESSGITWWDMDRGEWTYFESHLLTNLRSDRVSSIASDGEIVWFGTDEGLARYDKAKNQWRTYSVHNNLWDNRVSTVALAENALWIGTALGINRMDLSNLSISQIRDKRLIHRAVFHLEVDGDNVWAATNAGLYRFFASDNVWEYMSGYEGMMDLTSTAIAIYENEVWVGTDDGVMMLDQSNNEWTGYPAQHYPTGGFIHTILADRDNVWVGTDRGLLKFVKEENRWRRFTVEDGLMDNSVRWILLDGDYLWLGTVRGLTRFFWNAPYRID